MADLLGSDFSLAQIVAVPLNFLFRVVGHEVRMLVVRHHHRYPSFGSQTSIGVGPLSPQFEECRLEWTWILIGTSGGGGRDSESVQAS